MPSRTGLAAGLSNTCRLGGIAVGIAALGSGFSAGIGSRLQSAPACAHVMVTSPADDHHGG